MPFIRNLDRFVRMASAVVLLIALPAGAQPDVVQEAGPLAQPIGSKSVERLTTILKLDSEQKSLVSTLYTGYRAGYKQAAAAGNAEMEALQKKALAPDNHGFPDRKESFRIAQDFVDKQDKLESSFMDDLKAILTPEQAARFERAQRARRREIGCRFTFVAGEGVDLLQLLSELKIDRDSTPELKEVTEQYELDADRAMVAKDKVFRDAFKHIDKFEGPDPDPKLIEQMLTDFFTNGSRVRDVNRQSARKIEPLLPADKRSAFDLGIKKLSFPRIYSESHAEKAIKAAQGMADLSSGQKSELATLAESYAREAEGANARWAAAIEDKQSKIPGHFMEMEMSGHDEKSDDPLKVAREARKALDDRIVSRVIQLLLSDQREKLPKIEENSDSYRPEWEPNFDARNTWDEWKKEDQ